MKQQDVTKGIKKFPMEEMFKLEMFSLCSLALVQQLEGYI